MFSPYYDEPTDICVEGKFIALNEYFDEDAIHDLLLEIDPKTDGMDCDRINIVTKEKYLEKNFTQELFFYAEYWGTGADIRMLRNLLIDYAENNNYIVDYIQGRIM